jgi:predicted ATP-grasp superfamily ATP-dependent carboligase
MGNVLVTDGRQRSTLALVRSLGKKGIKVIVSEDELPCLSSRSKYCHRAFKYPSPIFRPSEFIGNLVTELQRGKYDLLVPMTDISSYCITQHKKKLSTFTKIPMVDWGVFNRASDKGEVVSLCQKLGLPVPKTYFVERMDEIINIASGLSYPVIIKPRRSKYFTQYGWVSTSVDYAHSLDEIIGKLKNFDPSLPLPLIQERIQGPGIGAFFLFDHGEEKACFFHKRIREKPPSGGVSVLRESIPVHPMMKEFSVRLLKALNWHGVAMVEFKLDEKDNLPKIMEINARFWGSLQLAIDSGVDFPSLLYQMETGGACDPVTDYKAGIKTRWLLGDLDHLLIRLFKSDKNLNLRGGLPGKLVTLKEFFKFWQPNTKYEVIDRDDFGPAVYEMKEYVKNAIKGIVQKLFID